MSSKIVTLGDGFRILDIDCECGTHSRITHEDTVYWTCQCGKEYFNSAYYYIDGNYVVRFNKHYWTEKKKGIIT